VKKTTILLSLLVFACVNIKAQERNQTTFDAAVAFGKGFSPAISASRLWGVGKQGRFKIGTGLRLTYYQQNDMQSITAPAALTSGEKGPQVIFLDNIASNLDTLTFPKVGVGYINIPVHLQYTFGKKLDLGFNIDVVGFSFGKKQTARFESSASASLNNTQQSASPAAFNLLLISDNDLGSLNSELYARYWVTPQLGIRVGTSFQFVEYVTDNLLTFGNDRFRAKVLQPLIAISIKY
jgi:hypothetical protein